MTYHSRSARRIVTAAALALVTLAACSDGSTPTDADPTPTSDAVDTDGTTSSSGTRPDDDVDDDAGATAGDSGSLSIDPATMPAPGVIVLAVGDERVEYRADDPDMVEFECTLATDRIDLHFRDRTDSTAFDVAASIVDGAWQGTGASRSSESGIRYSTNLDPSAVVLVDPPYTMVVSAFRSRPDTEPDASDDAGRGTISANCADAGDADDEADTNAEADADGSDDQVGVDPTTPDVSADQSADDTTTTTVPPAGSSDDAADGRVAVVEIGTVRYDLDSRPGLEIRCGFVDGVGGFLFGEVTTDGSFGIDALISNAAEADDPHILVIDEANDTVWQAGPIPSSAYADAGAGGVDAFEIDGDRITGTATFIDPRSDDTPARSGSFEFICP